MNAQEYFRDMHHMLDPNYLNNIEKNAAYLTVNCAGCTILPEPFHRVQPGGRNDYYLMYLFSGTLSVTAGETAKTITLLPGYLFVIPPHTYFQYYNAGSTPIQYLWIHFTGYGAATLLSDCSIPMLTPCNVGFPENTEEKFQALFRTFLMGEPILDIAATSRLMDICVLFGRAILLHTDFSPLPVMQRNLRLYTSLSYLHQNFSKPLNIPLLAEMEHLKVSRYRALFHEIYGISPLTYLTRLRMQQSLTLLTQTNLSIAKVSVSVGYEDPLYFSRAFRRMFNISPTEYRKRSALEKTE